LLLLTTFDSTAAGGINESCNGNVSCCAHSFASRTTVDPFSLLDIERSSSKDVGSSSNSDFEFELSSSPKSDIWDLLFVPNAFVEFLELTASEVFDGVTMAMLVVR